MSIIKNWTKIEDLKDLKCALNSMRNKFYEENNHEYSVILTLTSQILNEYIDILENVDECVYIKEDLIGKIKEITKFWYLNHKVN